MPEAAKMTVELISQLPEAVKMTVEGISQLPEEIQNEKTRELIVIADALGIYEPALKRKLKRVLGLTDDDLAKVFGAAR